VIGIESTTGTLPCLDSIYFSTLSWWIILPITKCKW